MLPRLRILQVGDVHYPTASKANRAIDDKDVKFPANLKGSLSSLPIKAVIQRIHAELSTGRIDALIFMGDLTDQGDLAGFKTCADWLMTALELAPGERFANLPVGFVPGNHDVDRTLATTAGLDAKFKPLEAAMAAAGATRFPTAVPLSFAIGERGASATVHLLNSCWGCGEPENIPAEFRDAIKTAIDGVIVADPRTASVYYDRQLDTPAFDAATITTVASAVSDCPPTSLSILVAHHNLLPQRTPRLAPYTELVNSGSLRGALVSSGRPCLYLHGHIHEDPVEIVHVGRDPPLVVISAPEASAGFNIVEVAFMRNGLPLTCEVVPFRYEAGSIRRGVSQSIPLMGERRRSTDRNMAKVYAHALEAGEVYWAELKAFAETLSVAPDDDTLAEMIELLAADGRFHVENRDLAIDAWIVKAVV